MIKESRGKSAACESSINTVVSRSGMRPDMQPAHITSNRATCELRSRLNQVLCRCKLGSVPVVQQVRCRWSVLGLVRCRCKSGSVPVQIRFDAGAN
jgi:hypothetical protein